MNTETENSTNPADAADKEVPSDLGRDMARVIELLESINIGISQLVSLMDGMDTDLSSLSSTASSIGGDVGTILASID